METCKLCGKGITYPDGVHVRGKLVHVACWEARRVETHLFRGQTDLDRYDPRQRRLV